MWQQMIAELTEWWAALREGRVGYPLQPGEGSAWFWFFFFGFIIAWGKLGVKKRG